MIIIEEIANADKRKPGNLGRLRIGARAATGPDFSADAGSWDDGHGPHACQWTAVQDGILLAAARLSIRHRLRDLPDAACFQGFERDFPAPIALLGQTAAQPELCGQEAPCILDGLSLGSAKYLGAKSAAIRTNASARMEQLRRLGFKLLGAAPKRTLRDQPSKVFALALNENSSGAQNGGGFAPGPDGAPAVRTANRMGWCSQVPNEITQAFIEAAAGCSYPVLDIGTGFGLASLKILERGASVVVNDACPEHLASFARTAAAAGFVRFKIAMGRIPDAAAFPDGSFEAIHASNILHFLTPSELVDAVRAMGRWLRPGGRAFVQVASPYVGGFGTFHLDYEARKQAGERWPGFMEDVARYASEDTAGAIGSAMNLMTADDLADVFRAAGFTIERAYLYRREGMPSRFHCDGRESSGLIARR